MFPKIFASGFKKQQVRRAKKEREARGEKALQAAMGAENGWDDESTKRWRLIWKVTCFIYFCRSEKGFHGSFQLIELYDIFKWFKYVYRCIVWFLCIVSGFLVVFYVMFLCFPCFPIMILIHTYSYIHDTYLLYIFKCHMSLCCYFNQQHPQDPMKFLDPPTKSYSSSHNHGSGKWVPSILVSLHLRSFSHFHNYGRKGKSVFLFHRQQR